MGARRGERKRVGVGGWTGGLVGFLVLIAAADVHAQNRGVYPLGMSATNSGVTPEGGFTLANQFLLYSRSRAKDNEGSFLPVTGNHSVLMFLTTLTWVSRKLPGGFQGSAGITVPLANNNLTSDVQGPLGGGSGLADTYVMPIIVAWSGDRIALRLIYGFLAPTGRFAAGASDNVGSGYWTHCISAGQTFHPFESRWLALSAFEMYEFHTPQEGTGIHPGQTLDLDYSVMAAPISTDTLRLQVGLVGYEQWQTTGRFGPDLPRSALHDRYVVNALGGAVQATLPKRQVGLGAKFFQELSNRSTFQGYSVQFLGSITF
jgi:hypothetical protein